MIKYKLHYNKTHVHGVRLCNQDNIDGNCSTVVDNVTCKKCKRILLNKLDVHGASVTSMLVLEQFVPSGTPMAEAFARANKNLG